MTEFEARFACLPAALPEAWIRRAGRLFHDQCWCWGRDVERAEGNLLVEYGFRRIATPEGRTFAYDLECAGERVVLAGAGLCYSAAGSTQAALIGRYDVRPRLILRCEVDTAKWAAVGVNVFQSVGARDEQSLLGRLLLIGSLRWIAGYEAWVRQLTGVEYRTGCLASWPQASVSADRIVEQWEALIVELEAARARL